MREQQHQTVALTPFVLGCYEVLVDDDLSAVDEVTELCLPHHQCCRVRMGIAVLESQGRILRQERVVHEELGGASTKVGERRILGFVHVVHQHRVSMAERAAAAIFARQAHGRTFHDQ